VAAVAERVRVIRGLERAFWVLGVGTACSGGFEDCFWMEHGGSAGGWSTRLSFWMEHKARLLGWSNKSTGVEGARLTLTCAGRRSAIAGSSSNFKIRHSRLSQAPFSKFEFHPP
jgi:hypothetical protein